MRFRATRSRAKNTVQRGEAFQPSNLDNQPVGMLDDGALEIVERFEHRRAAVIRLAQREQGPPGTYAFACVDRELNRHPATQCVKSGQMVAP